MFTAGAVHVAAQANPYKDGTPGVTGYRSEILAEVMIQEDKFTRLADAIPADKYAFRTTGPNSVHENRLQKPSPKSPPAKASHNR